MHTISLASHRYISPGISQKSSIPPAPIATNSFHGTQSKSFQIVRGKIFLAKLDKIHSTASSLANFF
jgi:hypothetical protein